MDTYFFNLINGQAFKCFYLDIAGIVFAKYFEYFLLFCLALFLIFNFKKYWKIISGALFGAVLSRFVIVEFIRWLWHRPRPFIALGKMNLLFKYSDEASFPSGHAAFYFALSTFIYFYNKKAGILFFIGSFLICLARVFVGIHWPSDILAGAIVGMLSAWLINRVFKKYIKEGRPN
jgi:undecaprenyl-diphosphatase